MNTRTGCVWSGAVSGRHGITLYQIQWWISIMHHHRCQSHAYKQHQKGRTNATTVTLDLRSSLKNMTVQHHASNILHLYIFPLLRQHHYSLWTRRPSTHLSIWGSPVVKQVLLLFSKSNVCVGPSNALIPPQQLPEDENMLVFLTIKYTERKKSLILSDWLIHFAHCRCCW